MELRQVTRRAAGRAACWALLCTLSACGGGDEQAGTPLGGNLRSPTTLSSANGKSTVYLGNWRSDCAMALLGGQVQSVYNNYRLQSVSGNKISAVFEQYQFKDSSCRQRWPSADLPPLTLNVTVQLLGTVDLGPPGDANHSFTGSADRIEVLTATGGAPPSAVAAKYMALDDKGGLILTTQLPFSSFDLVYRR